MSRQPKPSRIRNDLSRKKFLNRMVTCPGYAGEEMVAEAAEQSDQYQSTLAKLNRFNKGSKQKAKLQCHQKEWMEEWLQLQNSAQKLESDLEILLNDPILKEGDSESPFAEYIESKQSINIVKSDVSNHSREIKASMNQLVSIVNSADHKRYTQDEMNIFRVRLANKLLELHQWNAGCQSALDITESKLSSDLIETKKAVFQTVEKDLDMADYNDEEVKQILALLGELPPSARRDEEAEEVEVQPPMTSDQTQEDEVQYEILLVRSEISEKVQDIVRKKEEAKFIAEQDWLVAVRACLKGNVDDELLESRKLEYFGGWDQKEHEKFEIEYKQMISAGRSRERILDRLEASYAPTRSRKEVNGHILWIEACLTLASKKRSILEDFKRNRSDILNLAKQKFSDARQQILLNQERMVELAETKARCDALKDRLDELRPIREKANEEAMRLLRQKEESKRKELEKLAILEAANQKSRREAVNKYHEEKKAKELLRKKQEEEAAIALEAERVAKRAIDSMRVEYRSEKRKQQIASIQTLRWQAQVREARRLESIARIAASVPYFETINNLVADPMKPTAASDGWTGTFDGETFRKDPNSLQQGFSDEKLFANKGFRLGVELRAAGVHESKAAAAVIKAACPVARTPYAIS